jgi:hypothetical protein
MQDDCAESQQFFLPFWGGLIQVDLEEHKASRWRRPLMSKTCPGVASTLGFGALGAVSLPAGAIIAGSSCSNGLLAQLPFSIVGDAPKHVFAENHLILPGMKGF